MTDKPSPLTSAQKQRNRISELDAIARAAGWQSWSEYSTAVKRGAIRIAAKQAAALASVGSGGRPKKEQEK